MWLGTNKAALVSIGVLVASLSKIILTSPKLSVRRRNTNGSTLWLLLFVFFFLIPFQFPLILTIDRHLHRNFLVNLSVAFAGRTQ